MILLQSCYAFVMLNMSYSLIFWDIREFLMNKTPEEADIVLEKFVTCVLWTNILYIANQNQNKCQTFYSIKCYVHIILRFTQVFQNIKLICALS